MIINEKNEEYFYCRKHGQAEFDEVEVKKNGKITSIERRWACCGGLIDSEKP